LAVQSRPSGARVTVDRQERGVTPLALRLPSGAHVLEVQIGTAEPRVIPLTIQPGVQTSQYIELEGGTVTGALEIRSEPPGARVSIDGRPRGTTPATIRDLPAGDHSIVLELGGRKVTQAVKIEAGSTAQLVVPIPRR
ncbi:MAG TPA: PEGA domain-containing protein, partial [Vicinamibacterales bacterium]